MTKQKLFKARLNYLKSLCRHMQKLQKDYVRSTPPYHDPVPEAFERLIVAIGKELEIIKFIAKRDVLDDKIKSRKKRNKK